MKHWSLRWKLNALLLGIALFAVGVTALINYDLASSDSHDMALQMAYDKLQTIRSIKSIAIERHFSTVRNQMVALSHDMMLIDAIKAFTTAADAVPAVDRASRARLAHFYQHDFLAQYQQQNPQIKQTDINPILHQLDATGVALQSHYIADNPHPLGQKALLDNRDGLTVASDDHSYRAVHRTYHYHLREIQHNLELYDLFLVEPTHGRVIYSVFKETDFGSRLDEGPWAKSGLAKAYRHGLQLAKNSPPYLTDIAPYAPSYLNQALFISQPIYHEEKMIGMLIAQLSTRAIDNIISNNHKWRAIGDGNSGQSLLVGDDYHLRSDSRFRYQHEAAYLKTLLAEGEDQAAVDAIRLQHSTIGLARYDTASARSALKGEIGVGRGTNNRGVETLTAYQPLAIPGLHWVLVNEVASAEALAKSFAFQSNYKRDSLLITLIISLLALALSTYLSRRLTRPLEAVTTQIDTLSQGIISPATIDYHNRDEIGQLIAAATQLERGLQQTVDQAHMITHGNFNHDIQLLSDSDALGASLQQMQKTLRGLAATAQSIANGDYDTPIRVQGVHDQLGQALLTMVGALRDARNEAQSRNWLQSSLAELTAAMQGKESLETLLSSVLAQVAGKVNAPCATLFVYQQMMNDNDGGGTLICRGHYALNDQQLGTTIALGEGLVGQCARDLRHLTIDRLPEGYLPIRSTLGEAAPTMVTAIPLLADNQLAGVMELASFHPFNALEERLLIQLAPLLGVAIRALQQARRTEELLEESQTMAEELQTQEEELREGNATLEMQTEGLSTAKKQLEDQAEVLKQRAHELEEASRYKSEFLANMSHELRTPLNSLLILSNMLASNDDGNLSAKQQEYARTIHSSGQDLLELINSVLDLAKMEAGKMTLDPSRFALSEITESMQRDFTHIADDKRVTLAIAQASDLPETMFSDALRIKQVLKNLLSNAFKFVKSGGSVSLDLHRSGDDAIAFVVRDTGIGIKPEKLDDIFEAFQQEDGSTSRKYGGTGLGLSICREFSRLLGGTISVESEVGQGSSFTFTVPIVCAEKEEGSAPTQSPQVVVERPLEENEESEQTLSALDAIEGVAQIPNPLDDDRDRLDAAHKTILIIEDDEKFAALLQSLARDHSYQTITALRGDHGLWLARELQPDAILLDLQLPIIEGIAVLDSLKQHPSTHHIPVHIISCMDGENRQRLLQHGALSFLQKPAKQQDLDLLLDDIGGFLQRQVKRLLLVEDDLRQNMALRELLDDPEVEIVAKTHGEEALDYLRHHRVDCMILDMNLPDITGNALLATMKKEKATINEGHPVPIILHTASDIDPQMAEKIQHDVRSIVVKGAYSSERLLAETHLFLHHIEQESPPKQQSDHHTDLTGLADHTVLLVDDDVRNRFSLSSLLDGAGMKVYTARNGVEALQAIEEHGAQIDLVLMDIMMPEMDGLEAARRIRQMDRYKKLPIIALTAKAMKEDRDECIAAGASDFISKPIDNAQLMSVMQVWLHG